MTSGSVLDAVQLISIIKVGSDYRKTLVLRSRRRS